MKVTVRNPDRSKPVIRAALKEDTFAARRVSMDPEGRYAVVEPGFGHLFIAVRVVSCENNHLTGEYVDYWYDFGPDVPMLYRYSVSWDCIGFGFCKLMLFAPEIELAEQTMHRIYFDRELYEKSVKALHG